MIGCIVSHKFFLLFLQLLSLGKSLLLGLPFAVPDSCTPGDLANRLHTQKVTKDEKLFRALEQLVEVALGIDKSTHIQIQSYRVTVILVTLSKSEDDFEKFCTDLELIVHKIGHFLGSGKHFS